MRRHAAIGRRLNRGLLCLLLLVTAVWLGRSALSSHDPVLLADLILDLLALGGAVSGALLTRYPVILLGISLSGEWLLSVVLSFRIGYFARIGVAATGRALLPGIVMELMVLYACTVAVAFYRREDA